MSTKRDRITLNDAIDPPAKRQQLEASESALWSATDESFFSNISTPKWSGNSTKAGKQQQGDNGDLSEAPASGRDNYVLSATFEDSLFDCDILDCVESSQKSNVGATPMEQVLPGSSDIFENNTFFSEIDLDGLVNLVERDDEGGPLPREEDEIQCTQKFMEDMSKFKVPQVPPPETPTKTADHENNSSFISKSMMEAVVQGGGSQYETLEEIQRNRTKLEGLHNNNESLVLPNFDWHTQAFAAEREQKGAVEPFSSKGSFYGLPERVKQLIFEHKGIKSLYEWQDECLNLPAIRQRRNLIYALPTSGGKTLVAEILMLREIICCEKNVLFILPYVSIVQEKVSAMSPFAISLDFIVDEYTAGKGKCPPAVRKKRKSIYIASIEKGAVLMDSLIEAERAHEVGLIVVDELHLIGEQGRGASLEAFLTKVMFLNAGIQIVGMSATIGNLEEISAFLKADVYTRGFRPVELREFIKCGSDILEINAQGKTPEEVFVYHRTVNFKYSAAVLRADPDHLGGLVSECAPEKCCLVFCSSRKNCENVALLLSRILPKSIFLEHRKAEKADLMDALDKVCGILSPVLAQTIPYGIAYHHSGLTTDERRLIELAYRFGVLSVICCTSTLAAGVNLPAQRVIIRAPYVGTEFITLCRYKQMVGRAGRAGLGEAGESILITSSKDNVRVGEMLFSPMDKAISSLDYQEAVGLQGLILSAIGLGLAHSRRDLARLTDNTLLAVQATQLGLNMEQQVLNILRGMFKNRVLELCDNKSKLNGAHHSKGDLSDILTTQDVNKTVRQQQKARSLLITRTSRFQLTTIGKAAFKAGIDYKRAYAIYHELKCAQGSLILTNYDHLLYLVVAFNSNANGDELFSADAGILFRVFTTLDDSRQALFKLLGFGEAQAARMAKTLALPKELALKLNRLYKVLILSDVLGLVPIPKVAQRYNIERGMVQNLISQSTAAASAIGRLCDQIEDFWCFKPLFERVSAKMDRCGTHELEPLLELPAVKINRAKQLYAAGFRTIEDIAKCRPMQLVKSVEHLPLRVANEIVSAAKIILMKKLDHLEEETELIKMCLMVKTESEAFEVKGH